MKKILLSSLLLLLSAAGARAQRLETHDRHLDRVFTLAVQTLRGNVEAGIIKAGGAYGGEWTRDVAINVWNAANLLLPEEAERSLWHVTTDNRTMIGHQYWDQILWVTGAYDHYLVTQDTLFLRQACTASANTMRRLETEAFDAGYGLFTGPSVFNDGIAGYEEPVFDPGGGSSYVLDYPEARHVKCLSTNCIYYNAYLVLAQMSDKLGHGDEAAIYRQKADTLRKVIRVRFYDPATATFAYLIDGHGTVHHFQEGLGISFAILFGIVDRDEAARVVDGVYVAPYGLPSIYPAFKRFSKERPGRHNVLVWPFVSAFWADAALHAGREERFVSELENLCRLVEASDDCFYEIYDPYTGEVCGGWQVGGGPGPDGEWDSIHDQTWSATGLLRMVLRGMLGLSFSEEGLCLAPDAGLMARFGFRKLTDLRYQQGTIDLKRKGSGEVIREIRIDGMPVGGQTALLPAPHAGRAVVEIITE